MCGKKERETKNTKRERRPKSPMSIEAFVLKKIFANKIQQHIKKNLPQPSEIHPLGAGMIQHIQINMVCYINGMKDGRHMVIKINPEKNITKYVFMI